MGHPWRVIDPVATSGPCEATEWEFYGRLRLRQEESILSGRAVVDG